MADPKQTEPLAGPDTVRQSQGKKTPSMSTQTYLKVSEIRDDTLVLKNGGVRALLRVSSINFNLKSEDEQNAIIYSYQGFLNTLDFPIQIVVRSKKLIDQIFFGLMILNLGIHYVVLLRPCRFGIICRKQYPVWLLME